MAAKTNAKAKVTQSSEEAKNMLINLREKNLVRAIEAQKSPNLIFYKHTSIFMQYKKTSDFIARCSSDVVAQAMEAAGYIKLTMRNDGTPGFQELVDGKINPERVWWDQQLVEQTVRNYCEEQGINGKGIPIAKLIK